MGNVVKKTSSKTKNLNRIIKLLKYQAAGLNKSGQLKLQTVADAIKKDEHKILRKLDKLKIYQDNNIIDTLPAFTYITDLRRISIIIKILKKNGVTKKLFKTISDDDNLITYLSSFLDIVYANNSALNSHRENSIGKSIDQLILESYELESVRHFINELYNDATLVELKSLDDLGVITQIAIQINKVKGEVISSSTCIMKTPMLDPLTNLPLRDSIQMYLNNAINKAVKRKDFPVSILFIDVDNFKSFNSIYGHQIGDEVLIQLSQVLKGLNEGISARYGGDEFIVVLENASVAKAKAVARKIQNRLHKWQPTAFNMHKTKVDVSIGIVKLQDLLNIYPNLYVNDAISTANRAMFRAKTRGKAAIVDMHEYLDIETNIINDIKRYGFKNAYVILQPSVNLQGKVQKYEVLTRYKLDANTILPKDIFPIIQENNIINEFNTWLFDHVNSNINNWIQRKYWGNSMQFAINTQILDNKFITSLEKSLQKNNIEGSNIEIELVNTDQMLSSISQKDIENMLIELNSFGCSIAVDDFTSGCSIFTLDRLLPFIQTIKVGKASINYKNLLPGLIKMSDAYPNIKNIIIQGIEKNIQRERLLRRINDPKVLLQGYLIAKPMTLKTVELILSNGK